MANNKIILGDEVLLDLTEDTVTEDTLSEGVTAHDASGKAIVGTGKSGGASSWNDLTEKPFEDVGSDFDTSNDELQLSETVKESLGKADTALQSYEETDPTVPSHVKAITEQDISRWNTGGGGGASSWSALTDKPFETVGSDFSTSNNALQLSETVNTKLSNIDTIAVTVENLETTVDTLETTVGGLNTTVSGLSATVDGMQTDIGTMQTDISNLQDAIGDVEALFASL